MSKAVAAATMPPVLARLVGDWAGAGWSRHRPGQRPRPLAQTEAVRSHLDGLLLTVEGCGTAAGSAEVVHRAFAVISGAGHGTRLRWTAYVAEGCTDTELTMHPDGFEWLLDAGPAGRTRFRATLTSDRWRETGEQQGADGSWTIVFAMDLSRRPGPVLVR